MPSFDRPCAMSARVTSSRSTVVTTTLPVSLDEDGNGSRACSSTLCSCRDPAQVGEQDRPGFLQRQVAHNRSSRVAVGAVGDSSDVLGPLTTPVV